MRRLLLVLAMLFSLWPLTLVAIAVASGGHSGSREDVTVTVPPEAHSPQVPVERKVTLQFGGKTYSCPPGTEERVKPYLQTLGEVELKLRSLRASLKAKEGRLNAWDKQYPQKEAPNSVVDAYNATARSVRAEITREHQLVHDYNQEANAYNHFLDSECS